MRLRLCLLIFTALPSFATVVEPVVTDAVTDQFRPLSFDRQHLSGLFAARIRANIEGYLESQGRAGANGANIGQYLDAAANSFDYTHDSNLGADMEKAAKLALSSSVTKAETPDRLMGLLSYYRVTGNEAALAKCKQLGGAILNRPLTSASLVPMLSLYRYTGDRRYFDYSKKLVQSLYRANPSGAFTWPDSNKGLTQLLGLTEFYRITGDETYLKAVTGAWRQIQDGHITATGTLNETVAEPDAACATLTWMQLTLGLFRLTGQTQYGDALERTTYNQLLAGQDGKSGKLFGNIPLNGTKSIHSGDACACDVPRGIALLPAMIWGRYASGIAINFYVPGNADVRLRHLESVHLYEETTFPDSGNILLHVEPDHRIRFPLRFPLRLRVPDWAASFTVTINSSRLTGRPGRYVVLNRKWKRGDTVKIAIAMNLKLVHPTPTNPNAVALQRGPQILSLSKDLNLSIQDLSAVRLNNLNVSQWTVTRSGSPEPVEWQANQAYTVQGITHRSLTFEPFADAKIYRTSFPSMPSDSARDRHQ